MPVTKTVHHADVVGSLLRSQTLIDARNAMRAGKLSYPEYRAIEDGAVDDAIKLQEDVGLQVVTDGELRRDIYFGWWVSGMDGLSRVEGESGTVKFRGKDTGADYDVKIPFSVTGKVTAKDCPGLDEFAYASSKTDKQVKVTLPSPLILMSAFWNEHSQKAYPDPFVLAEEGRDVVAGWMKQLADAGCTYMQVDTPELAVAYAQRDSVSATRGQKFDPEKFVDYGAELIGSLAELDLPGVTLAMHVCKGNGTQSWRAEGGYSEFSKHVFKKAGGFDIYHLEYDDERSGDFKPLENLPDDKIALLGLVSTKWTEIEDADMLKGRIEEAAQYHPAERLGISTQCGFASAAETAAGRKITDQTQIDKLKLIVDVAQDVWG